MTATNDGREILLGLAEMLKQLVILTQDSSVPISKDAVSALVNITGDESGTNALLIISESNSSTNTSEYSSNLIEVCIK